MDIRDFLGYRLTCKISKDWKEHSQYTDEQFSVVIEENKSSDYGYIAKVNGEEYDAEIACKNILFETWIIVSKEKI